MPVTDRDSLEAIHVANATLPPRIGTAAHPVTGTAVEIDGERFYRIRNADAMPPFLMTLLSATDVWAFIASNGGLTAGRTDAESALFPYVTQDKLIDTAAATGPLTVLLVTRQGRTSLWEPLHGTEGLYRTERNLYKNELGSTILFEEINHDLHLRYRYGWRASDRYGLVRSSLLVNEGDDACKVDLVDGLQNVLPSGVPSQVQNTMSNLLDAYKRSEFDAPSGLGTFTLSSILTDLAEPMEALRATVVWQTGLTPHAHFLQAQPYRRDAFRRGESLPSDHDVRGRRGCYLTRTAFTLQPGEHRTWRTVADVGLDHAAVVSLRERRIHEPRALDADLERDLAHGTDALRTIVARADGWQVTRDREASARHVASVLFNAMRGGTFPSDVIDVGDLTDFVATRDRHLAERHAQFFANLPRPLLRRDVVTAAVETGCPDLERLCRSYLPLAFSRRHGDPSRPWNRFAIRVRNADGTPRLDYEGNWRDIFQNWEALGRAFPDYLEAMICTFLNATTADGYNPYRITRAGFEWEVPAPEDPWANIGYWSDHQIIYLQKLLELSFDHFPGALDRLATRRVFAHADVPYRIRPYEDLLEDPFDTIEFDRERHDALLDAVRRDGHDATLARASDGTIVRVTMTEKMLLLLLVKLTSLVPEGGIWMHTQRPEWNDANNALVGKGLSVVTVAYLVRYVASLRTFVARQAGHITVSPGIARLLGEVEAIFARHADALEATIDDARRRFIMDALGRAGSAYREALYRDGPAKPSVKLDPRMLEAFLAHAEAWLTHTLRANRRQDATYHAYNLLALEHGEARIAHLPEMLEGQVAVLSSGVLTGEESLALLEALRQGRLHRPDQDTYLLYPDRELPGFLRTNAIPPNAFETSPLLTSLLERGDRRLVTRDVTGGLHFAADLRNARDVLDVLDALAQDEADASHVEREREAILALYERVFDHASFTGRSGTFFAYEGLGSIYWHMVSKLQLAVQETWCRAVEIGEDARIVDALADAYYAIRAGLGFHKTPYVYGAFPTDPYSHTPAHAGAQQPGMTGQVKEDVLTRLGELGVWVRQGCLHFDPSLLREDELLATACTVTVPTADGERHLELPAGSLAFTVCGAPVVYRIGERSPSIRVTRRDGHQQSWVGMTLGQDVSREVFARSGDVTRIDVDLPASTLATRNRISRRFT